MRICAVTGSRAEYGALRWLLKDWADDSAIDFKLIVTGAHWLKEYGNTFREIENDGLTIDAKVYSEFDSRSAVSLTHALGRWTAGMGDVLKKLNPDLVVVMGDRYELLAILSACLLLLIPVAHISGGDVTEGAIDEQIRHAATKMSHLHLAANPLAAQRIRQMGEEPWRICISGEPGLDALRRMTFLTRQDLEKSLRLDLSRPTALCTFHPTTLSAGLSNQQADQLLKALLRFPLQYIWTYPNADFGSQSVISLLKAYANKYPDRIRLISSLGQTAYLSLLRQVTLMIGNSSSGLIEAPSFNLPAVNISDRQQGRLRAKNVIDVGPTASSLTKGIQTALSYDRSHTCGNPYGDGRSSARIRRFIGRALAFKSREQLLKKKFVTLKGVRP